VGTYSVTDAGRALSPMEVFQGADAVALGHVRVPAVLGPESAHTPQAQNRDCSTATLVTLYAAGGEGVEDGGAGAGVGLVPVACCSARLCLVAGPGGRVAA
jgi:hypothetical protein